MLDLCFENENALVEKGENFLIIETRKILLLPSKLIFKYGIRKIKYERVEIGMFKAKDLRFNL